MVPILIDVKRLIIGVEGQLMGVKWRHSASFAKLLPYCACSWASKGERQAWKGYRPGIERNSRSQTARLLPQYGQWPFYGH